MSSPSSALFEEETTLVDEVVARARKAQQNYALAATQARYDQAALAAAWALMEPSRNKSLSELAVKTTGLGNVADKIQKMNQYAMPFLKRSTPKAVVYWMRKTPQRLKCPCSRAGISTVT